MDEVILLGRSMGGTVPQLRMQGMERGIHEILGEHGFRIVHVNGDGHFDGALRAIRRHLRFGNAVKTLVAAINDPIGARRAACIRRSRDGSRAALLWDTAVRWTQEVNCDVPAPEWLALLLTFRKTMERN